MTDPTYTHRSIIHMAEQAAKAGLPHIGACPFNWRDHPEEMRLWMRAYNAKRAEMEAENYGR